VDPLLLLREMLGHPGGLCGGKGGHMHLFSKDHLAASSGIVGSSGPSAAGFALAAQHLRPGTVAVAFFGDGAMNQGMLMESLNLAAVWHLPILFVCKDDGWAIVTRPEDATGGSMEERVRGLGVRYVAVDGLDAARVWDASRPAIQRARKGEGPTFLHANCVHLEGHFLGLPLLRVTRDPLRELPGIAGPLLRSFLHSGAGSLRDRLAGVGVVLDAMEATRRDPRESLASDPVALARGALMADPARLKDLETGIETEIAAIVASAAQGAAA